MRWGGREWGAVLATLVNYIVGSQMELQSYLKFLQKSYTHTYIYFNMIMNSSTVE